MKLLLPALLVFLLSEGEATSCPNTSAIGDTKPLYLLTLVPFPDPKNGSGWDEGLSTVPGARVARDEINSRTDLLPDHHIELIVENVEACSHTDTIVGLGNLIKYTVNPPCRPVAAIMGLLCSSHTSILSPVAGHTGFDLMQLAVANSPQFVLQNHRFPHLWRFFGSAIVYADTVLAIMDQFNWHRIGIVYNTGSIFFSDFAKYFELKIRSSRDKYTVFSVAVAGTAMYFFDSIITNMKTEGVTILVVLLNEQQTTILLERTLHEGLIYPYSIWIQIQIRHEFIFNGGKKGQNKFYRATRGHIHIHTSTETENDTVLASGVTFATFEEKYQKHFEQMKQQYKGSNLISDVTYAKYLYDQVWAFALAVNNSLPELKNRNLSIDSYTIGQKEITGVFEAEMAKLSFQGAGGIIKFNQYHEVSVPVEVHWVFDNNGTEKLVGIYNPLNLSDFYVIINDTDLPKDSPPRVLHVSIIPVPVAILLYIISCAVIAFTTVQLLLLLHYRDQKVVKASSPYLSLLMFAGCYFLCLASICIVTTGSFLIPARAFTILIIVTLVLIVNGMSMILVTLFIRLLRVYRLFLFVFVRHGKHWKTLPLILIAVSISIFPNIILAVLIGLDPPRRQIDTVYSDIKLLIIEEKHIQVEAGNIYNYVILIGVYFALFLLLIVFLAVRTRKIKYENFKDTKKVNFFIAILITTSSFAYSTSSILFILLNEPAANVVTASSLLVIPIANQLIIFLPKVLPVLLEKNFPRICIFLKQWKKIPARPTGSD